MGNDQSGQLKAPADANDSSSFSTAKPIDDQSYKSKDGAHEIVVVTKGATASETQDLELIKLQSFSTIFPFIKNPKDTDFSHKLNHSLVLKLCLRYQEHLKQCGETVSFDQNSLSHKIKEMDHLITHTYAVLTERQKKYAKFAEQLGKVSEVQHKVNKIKMNFRNICASLDKLNADLPEASRLEDLSLQLKSSSQK